MMIDVESGADFVQYYGSRYLKGKDGRVYWCTHPAQRGLRNINSVEFQVSHPNENSWVRETLKFEELPNRLFFGLPKLGCLVLGDELLYLSYWPTRDGGRGLDLNRIQMTSFNSFDLQREGIKVFSLENYQRLLRPDKVKALLFPEYTPLSEVSEAIANPLERLAFALDYNFGVFLSSQDESPVLTYKHRRCGSLVNGEPVFNDEPARLIWEGK